MTLNIQYVPPSKHSVPVIKTSQLMLYREITAVCSEIHSKHINTLCGQNVELLNVIPGGTYSNHWVLQGYEDCGEFSEVHRFPNPKSQVQMSKLHVVTGIPDDGHSADPNEFCLYYTNTTSTSVYILLLHLSPHTPPCTVTKSAYSTKMFCLR
jgi:hypothetical protein